MWGDCEIRKIKESSDRSEQQSPEKSGICMLYFVRWMFVPRYHQSQQHVGLFERAGERSLEGASWQIISSDKHHSHKGTEQATFDRKCFSNILLCAKGPTETCIVRLIAASEPTSIDTHRLSNCSQICPARPPICPDATSGRALLPPWS